MPRHDYNDLSRRAKAYREKNPNASNYEVQTHLGVSWAVMESLKKHDAVNQTDATSFITVGKKRGPKPGFKRKSTAYDKIAINYPMPSLSGVLTVFVIKGNPSQVMDIVARMNQ